MPVSKDEFEGIERGTIVSPKKKQSSQSSSDDGDDFSGIEQGHISRSVKPITAKDIPAPKQNVQQAPAATNAGTQPSPAPAVDNGGGIGKSLADIGASLISNKKPLQSVVNGTDPAVDAQKMEDARRALKHYVDGGGNPAMDIYNKALSYGRKGADSPGADMGSAAANSALSEITPAHREMTQATAKAEIEASKQFVSQFLGQNRKDLENMLIVNNRPTTGSTEVNHGEPFVQPGMADIGLTKMSQGNGTGVPIYSTLGQNLATTTGIFSKDNFVSRLFDLNGDTKAVTQFYTGAIDLLSKKEQQEKEAYLAAHSNIQEANGSVAGIEGQDQANLRAQGHEAELKAISDRYADQRKSLTQAIYNIAAVKAVNRRIHETGTTAYLDPVEIGMEVRGQMGDGKKVDKDIALIKKGGKLDPDDAVSYALDGYRAQQVAMMDNYANDRSVVVKNLAGRVKDYQKKILKDNPEFVRNQAIRALSDKLYENSSAVGSFLGDTQITDEQIQSTGKALGLPNELLHGIRVEDIQNPRVWYKRAAGEFVKSTAGGLYKTLLRGAGIVNDAMGGNTDWEFANQYLDHDWYENTDVPFIGGKQLMGKTPDAGNLFGAPSRVNADPLSKDYLFNEANPNAGKFNWDVRAILNQIGEGGGSLLGLTAGAGEVGKLYEAGSTALKAGQGLKFAEGTAEAIDLAKRADRFGLTASTFLTGLSDNYSDAVRTFPDEEGADNSGLEAKRNLYAILKTGVSALAMQVLPHTKAGQELLRPGTVAGDDLISYVARNGVENVDRTALGRIISNAIKSSPDYAKAVSIGNIDQLGQGMVDALLAPKKYETSDQWEIQKQSAISGMIGMAVPILGGPIMSGAFENRMQRSLLWEAGKNPQPIIDQINTMVKEGQMDPNEGNQRIAAVNTMADILGKHTPTVSPENGLPLTIEQQQAYAQKFLVETMLGKQAEGTADEVAKKAIEKRITQLRKERSDILEQAGDKQIRDKVARAAEARKNSRSSQNQNQNGNEKSGQENGQEVSGKENASQEEGVPGQGQGRNVNSGEASAGEQSPADLYKNFVNEDENGNEIDPENAEEASPNQDSNATENSNQPAEQEGRTEGGVREHPPVDGGQQGQAEVEEALPRTDSGDSNIGSEGGQEGAKEKAIKDIPAEELNKPGTVYNLIHEKYDRILQDPNQPEERKRTAQAFMDDPVGYLEGSVKDLEKTIQEKPRKADAEKDYLQAVKDEIKRIKDLQSPAVSEVPKQEVVAPAQPEQPAVEPVAEEVHEPAERDVKEIFNTRKPIAEDSPEIRAQIDRINQNSETIAKLDELAKNTADEEQRADINARSLRLGEVNHGLENEVVNSRREVKESVPIMQEARKAKVEGQRALNKLKKDHVGIDGDVNEWKKGMPVSEQEFNDLQDAVKRLSIRETEVTSNEELQKDIDAVNETLKKLSVKGNTEVHSPTAGETIETQELKDRVEDQKLRTGDAQKRRENGSYIDREGNTYTRNPENTDAPVGKSGTVQFTTKEEPEFQYQLLEARDIQPSHIDGRRNPRFFIPEAQPKNRTDDASKAAAEAIANKPRLDLLGADTGAYSGAPIVNGRGEVIQGNNRTESLRKHYEKGLGDYKDQLINEAEQFGFTPEQVDAMKEPVLVRRVNVDDEKAIELGQYTQADRESSDKRNIDPVTTARRIPADRKRAISEAVIGDGAEELTLNKLVRQNYRKAMELLKDYITPTQYQSLVDKNLGKPTESGVNDIEKLITHFLFEGGDNELPELFAALDARQKKNILNALPSIFGSSPETSLVPDMQQVVIGLNHFETSASGKLSAWLSQPDIFQGGRTPREMYTPFEIKVMELLDGAKNTREVAKIFQKYGELVKGKPKDLLGEAEPGLSKAEAIRQTFDVPYNDVHEAQEAQSPAPAEGAGSGNQVEPEKVHQGEQQPATGGEPKPSTEPAGDAGDRPAPVEHFIDEEKADGVLTAKQRNVVKRQRNKVIDLDKIIENLDLSEFKAEVINDFINKNSDENGNLDWEKVDAVIGGAGDDPVKITEAIVKNNERQKENDDNAAAGEAVLGDSGTEGDSEGRGLPRTNLPASRNDVAAGSGHRPRLTTVGANLTPAVESRVSDGLKQHLAPHQVQGADLALNALATGKKAFLLADGAGAGKTRTLLAFVESANKPVTIVTENRDIINGSFKNDAQTMGLSFSATKDGVKIGKYATIVTVPDFRSGKYPKNDVLVFDESQNASGTETKTFEELQKHKGFVLYASATPFDTIQKTLYMVPRLLGISEKAYLNEIGGKWQDSHRGGRELVIQDAPYLLQTLQQAHQELMASGQLVSRYFPFHGNNRGSIQLRNDVADAVSQPTEKFGTHPDRDRILKNMTLADAEAGVNAYYGRRIKLVRRMGLSQEDQKKPGMTVDKKMRQLREDKNNELKRLSDTFKATKELAQTVKRDLADGKQVVIYSPNITESLKFNYGEPQEEGGENDGGGGSVSEFEYTRPSFFHQFSEILNKEGIKFESLTGENKKRHETVDRFQKGDVKVLLINQAGTTGINLNDTKGDSPRILYKVGNPPNAIQNDQLEGRVSRLNNASKAEVVAVRNGGEGDRLAAESHEEKAALMNAFVKGEVPGQIPGSTPVAEGPAEPPKIEELNDKQFLVVNTRGNAELRKAFDAIGGNYRDDKKGWAFPNAKKAAVEEILANHKPAEKPTYGYDDLPDAIKQRNQGPAMDEGVRYTSSAPRIEEIKAENEAAHQQLTPAEREVVQRPEVQKAVNKANEAIDKVEITPEQEAAIDRLAEGDIDEHVARLKDEIDLNLPPEELAQEVLKKLTNEGSKEPGLAERPAPIANEGEVRSGQPEQNAEEQGLPQGADAKADIAGPEGAERRADSGLGQAPEGGDKNATGGQSTAAIAKPEKTGDPRIDAVNEQAYWQNIIERKQRAIELATEREINNPDEPRYRGSAKWELDQVALKQAQVNLRNVQIEEKKRQDLSKADKLRNNLKIKGGDKLLTTPAQIPVALWNAAVEIVALAVEAGAHINAAVQRGVDYVQNHHFTQWDERAFRKSLGEGQAIPPTAAELRGQKDDGVKLHPANRAAADALLDKIRNNQETLFGALHNIDGLRHLSAATKGKIKSYIRDYANAEIFKSTGDQWADKHLQNNNYDYKAAMRDLVDDVHMQMLGATDPIERENIQKKYAAAKTVIEAQETSHLVETGQITPKYKKDPGPDPTFELPEHNWKNSFKENIFDVKNRLVEAQKVSNDVITDANDAVKAMTLAPGKAHYLVKEVQDYLGNGEYKKGSFFDRMKHDGIDIRRLGLFLYAEHAPEANAKIAGDRQLIFDRKLYELNDRLATEQDPTKAGKIQAQIDDMLHQTNPSYPLMPDGGSGMTNQQAADLMAEFHSDGVHGIYQKYADEFRENVVKKILEWKHDTGLIDDDFYNTLRNAFKKYVPLKVDMEGEELTPDQKKSNYAKIKDSGRDIYRRYGSVERGYDERNNPALQAIHDLETSIRMGEANKAHNVLAQLVRENPNPSIWEVRDAKYEVVNDANGNVIKATEADRPTAPAIEFRENGKKKYVVMHDPGLQKLARVMKVNGFVRFMQKATQLVRATNTLYNPDFIIKNPFMDFGDAWLNLVPEENKDILKNFTAYSVSAPKAAVQLAFGGENAEWNGWRDRAKQAGGMITFAKNMDITESAKRVMKLYEKYHDPLGAARIKHAFRAFENFTGALEEMTRTMVFRAAVEAGESDSHAAMLSRNATVDFEKKGLYGTYINAFKAFANASIQGLANLSFAAMRSKKVRGFLVSMVGAGFAEAAMNDMAGDCEGKKADCWWEVPDYRKMRNFTIPTGNGHTPASIPLPRQFAWFNYIGKNLYALAKGQMDGGEFVSKSVSSLFDFYNPAGGSEPLTQQVFGNLAPIAGLAHNQSSFGGPIYPDNKNRPDHEDFWPNNTPIPYQKMADFLSEISGGNDKTGRAGKIELSPNELEYVVQNTFGGIYGAFRNITNGVRDMNDPKTGNHWEHKHIPIVRIFHSESDMAGTKEKYYKMVKFAEENLLNDKEHQNLLKYADELVASGQWTPEQKGKALKYVEGQQAAVRSNVHKRNTPKPTTTGGAGSGW